MHLFIHTQTNESVLHPILTWILHFWRDDSYERKLKDMNVYAVTEVMHTELTLHDIKSVILAHTTLKCNPVHFFCMPIEAISCLFVFCRMLLTAANVYAFCLYSGHFNTSYIV